MIFHQKMDKGSTERWRMIYRRTEMVTLVTGSNMLEHNHYAVRMGTLLRKTYATWDVQRFNNSKAYPMPMRRERSVRRFAISTGCLQRRRSVTPMIPTRTA